MHDRYHITDMLGQCIVGDSSSLWHNSVGFDYWQSNIWKPQTAKLC